MVVDGRVVVVEDEVLVDVELVVVVDGRVVVVEDEVLVDVVVVGRLVVVDDDVVVVDDEVLVVVGRVVVVDDEVLVVVGRVVVVEVGVEVRSADSSAMKASCAPPGELCAPPMVPGNTADNVNPLR